MNTHHTRKLATSLALLATSLGMAPAMAAPDAAPARTSANPAAPTASAAAGKPPTARHVVKIREPLDARTGPAPKQATPVSSQPGATLKEEP